jgi:hypothetical protein
MAGAPILHNTEDKGKMTEKDAVLVPNAVHHGDHRGPLKRIGPAGLRIIEQMAADGHADIAIAKALRMHQETLRMCRRRQPEVQEALDRGRAALEGELVHYLLDKVRKDADGGIIASFFLLKTRCGYREQGSPPDERPNLVINLPGAMSRDVYLNTLQTAPPSPGEQQK